MLSSNANCFRKKLLALLDRHEVAAWFTNCHGKVDICNKMACDILERTHDEMMGLPLADEFVVENDKSVIKSAIVVKPSIKVLQ